MGSLYSVLAPCRREEEVKAEFCRFFGMKLRAVDGIDHYTEQVLFEFKFDLDLRRPEARARVLAQMMYYARRLRFARAFARYPLPPALCAVGRDAAFFAETRAFARFHSSASETRYDWDRAPSTPCPRLVRDLAASPAAAALYVHDLTRAAECAQFEAKCRERLTAQMSFLDLWERKPITEENFLEVYDYWAGLFGDYVRNGRKPSAYFFADIEEGKSIVSEDGRVMFGVAGTEGFVPKLLDMKAYRHFWQNYEKVPSAEMAHIRQMADRLTENYHRRFTGEFYTPVPFAEKALRYIERTVGKEWWASGEWRLWDMAAGTGNLEFALPSGALPSCYLSTLDKSDADYCRKIFPGATCFQYDYLADDIPRLTEGELPLGYRLAMPPNLAADLANPKLKWIILINPPFATANTVGGETGKRSKDAVSMTTVRELMTREGYGEASRELYIQFLYRIAREFKGRTAFLGLFAPLKYINSNNNQRIRDGFFQYRYTRGFIFPSRCFYGATGRFPVGFLVWDLAKRRHLERQRFRLDVLNEKTEMVGRKRLVSVRRETMLNKWCPRPRWDGKSVMPTFISALNLMTTNKDRRNHVAPGFLFSLASKGDDLQNQNGVFILSAPYANAGAFSVTPENFERAMVLHAVKRLPKVTWVNDCDTFYAPTRDPSDEFVTDCAVWSAFADSNYAVSLRDVAYQGRMWRIANNLYPFRLRDVRRWTCVHPDLAAQLSAANEDRFLARWLASRELSPEARTVMDAARTLYRAFYANLTSTPWMKWKIETWDVGFYQVRSAMKALGGRSSPTAGDTAREDTRPPAAADAQERVPPADALRAAHDALREKLLPQVYSLGFLSPDVEYFT